MRQTLQMLWSPKDSKLYARVASSLVGLLTPQLYRKTKWWQEKGCDPTPTPMNGKWTKSQKITNVTLKGPVWLVALTPDSQPQYYINYWNTKRINSWIWAELPQPKQTNPGKKKQFPVNIILVRTSCVCARLPTGLSRLQSAAFHLRRQSELGMASHPSWLRHK